MCLIAYSPDGAEIPADIFDYASVCNPDGIGIMSERGVYKFHGKKAAKRARRHLRQIKGTPFGIHFRWATHGSVSLELCHPFKAPESDAYVMHNGIIGWAGRLCETEKESDTSVFVHRFMKRAPKPGDRKYQQGFYDRVTRAIGYGNKLLVFHSLTGEFTLCNEDEGLWLNGLWYSNDYSLPSYLQTNWKYSGNTTTEVDKWDDAAWSRWLDGRGKKLVGLDGEPIGLTRESPAATTINAAPGTTYIIGPGGQLQKAPALLTHETPDKGEGTEYDDRVVSDAVDRAEAHALVEYYRAIERDGEYNGYFDNGTHERPLNFNGPDIPGTARDLLEDDMDGIAAVGAC